MHEVRRLKQDLSNREPHTLRKCAADMGLTMNKEIKKY